MCHGIGFIEDDDFVWRARVLCAIGGGGVRELHACEVFDFLADDANSALVGGVEFENAGLDQFGAVELFS